MALIVEDGTSKVDSEAYASVAEADTYVEKYGVGDQWLDSLEEQKEVALRLAAQAIDTKLLNMGVLGVKTSSLQSMLFPRFDVEVDNVYLDSDEIPRDLKRANIELAVRYRNDPTTALMPDRTSPGVVISERVRVGDIEEELMYDASGKGQDGTEYRLVESLLAPYTSSGYGGLMGTTERS